MTKKILLIIYKNSDIPNDIRKFENLCEIKLIQKFYRKNLINYNFNVIAQKYNDLIFSTDSVYIAFISSSEIKHISLNKLLNPQGDFSYFTTRKTNDLIQFLSGFIIKKDVLIKTGSFDKFSFYNLYLNFLINYSRFYKTPNIVKLNLKLIDYVKYIFWKNFEKAFYLSQPLYKQDYFLLSKQFELTIFDNTLKKILRKIIERKIKMPSPSIINNFIRNTFKEYY